METLYVLLAIGGGLLVLLIVGAFVGGRFLPERYEARIVVELQRKPQDIWDAVIDIEKNPLTGKMCKRIEKRADVNGMPSWLEDLGSTTIIATTEEMQPPVRLRRRFADQVVPMTAETEIVIEETAIGSRITASGVMVIRSGTWHVPIFRIMMKLTGGGRSQLKSYWTRLAKGLSSKFRFPA